MKYIFRRLFALYLIIVFLPVVLTLTLLTAILTILFSLTGDHKWCYIPARIWARLICALAFLRVRVRGKENYAPDKSYIFVANHQSILDIFLIYGWLNNRFKWIMKKELRSIPFVGAACEAAGHIFIDRSSGIRAKKSIEKAKERLQHGASVVIFPEGTRTHDGNVGQFKRGAFRIAQDIHLPIIPITIKGAFEAMPYNSLNINPGRLEMIIHPPVNIDELTDDALSRLMAKTHDIISNK
ncbi:MAG: 1-acyl-sn-glycerol-3-phosphate acyltransferase [Prevotellaceae bacterium]|jgi:1-acyl-sn-glycerol-3-phosphate acyltransferase|nr:1-acyl-sn-glycerol-3-phosphate acyltransferase [Prevotellaceae bacterium]